MTTLSHRSPTSRRALLALVCLVLVAAAAFPSAAAAAEKAIWGPTRYADGRSMFPTYEQLGVDVYMPGMFWNEISKREPRSDRAAQNPNDTSLYDWGDLDYAYEQSRKYGIQLAPLVMRTPQWATTRWGDRGRTWQWAPDRDQDYANFLIAATKRYPGIRRWQIWGEPGHENNFQPTGLPTSARRYAKLLDRAYVTLKSRSSANKVIGGMTYMSGKSPAVKFLRELKLPDGKRPRLDWWGHNPFSERFPDNDPKRTLHSSDNRDINDLDVFAREIKSAYASRGIVPRIWISEYTIQNTHASTQFNFFVRTTQDQARWVKAAYGLANRQSSIAGLGWLFLQDQAGPRSGHGQEAHWGLLTSSNAKKPSFNAYRDVPSAFNNQP